MLLRKLPLLLCATIALLTAPAQAQKIMADTGFYAHNWTTLHNNLDAANGTYVYFFTNQQVGGGPPTLGDNVRKCWTHEIFRGGKESQSNGHRANWVSVVQGTNAASGPSVGLITVVGLADPLGAGGGPSSDICIAPFTTNPIFITGGFFFNFGSLGLVPGFFVIGFQFAGGGPIIPVLGFNNSNACLEGMVVYELQHGYNGTANNQQYLHVVSIDEITFPRAGGISQGLPRYGQNEWGPVVGPGGVVSHSRFISFSGNAILLLAGQTIEGNGDGLELNQAIGLEEPSNMGGRRNGVTDCNGQPRMDYGAGGTDWVSCQTSGVNGANRISLRTMDYFWAQRMDPASLGFQGPNVRYFVEYFWSGSPTIPCGFNTIGLSDIFPGQPLDMGFPFDAITNQFNANPKAQANVKFGAPFEIGVTQPRQAALFLDGCWPAYCQDGVTIGRSALPRGGPGLLSLCNPKAANFFLPQAQIYVNSIVWCDDGTNGPKRAEAGNAVRIPVF